jgi:hypothetical protein
VAEPPQSPPLLDLYKIAIDEYRFEVKLGWDRTMYYLVFNTAIISVGTGLLKLESAPITIIFVAAIFFVGFCTSLMAFGASRTGHEYYRRTIVKKTLLEDVLGLTAEVPGYPLRHTLAIGTTHGQGECLRILHDTPAWIARGPRRKSMTYLYGLLFLLLAMINVAGIGTCGWMYFRPVEKESAPRTEQPQFIPIHCSPGATSHPSTSTFSDPAIFPETLPTRSSH